MEENVNLQYQTLRFIRLLAVNPIILMKEYDALAQLYFWTVLNPSGKIRNGGYQFLGNFQFGISLHAEKKRDGRLRWIDTFDEGISEVLPEIRKATEQEISKDMNDRNKIISPSIEFLKDKVAIVVESGFKEVRRTWLRIFNQLVEMEHNYIQENKKNLRRKDYAGKYQIHSSDTEDKLLLNIRRGLQTIDHGFYFDAILEEFGYLEHYRHPEEIAEYEGFKERYDRA
ncbi:MAG: hypothetical protein ACOCXP_03625 [Candidatus Dojkabacteria bacterium]